MGGLPLFFLVERNISGDGGLNKRRLNAKYHFEYEIQ